MLKVIGLQSALLLLVAAIAGLWVGDKGAISAMLGGLAYLVPNLLFVLRLKRADAAGKASVVMFFVGELLKVACTVAIMFVIVRLYGVHWLSLMAGLVVTLKANLFGFLLKT